MALSDNERERLIAAQKQIKELLEQAHSELCIVEEAEKISDSDSAPHELRDGGSWLR